LGSVIIEHGEADGIVHQHLLAQHPIRHGCPSGALETGHTEAGKRTALAKRPSSIKAVNVNRFPIREYRTRPTKIHFAASLIYTIREPRLTLAPISNELCLVVVTASPL
jgi:hypothetical protein